MSAVNLQLNLPDGRTVAVSLPERESPRRLAPALVSKLSLPVVDEDGAALAYYLAPAGGERLPDDTPLVEIPVVDGAALTLVGVKMPAVDGRLGNHDVLCPGAGADRVIQRPPAEPRRRQPHRTGRSICDSFSPVAWYLRYFLCLPSCSLSAWRRGDADNGTTAALGVPPARGAAPVYVSPPAGSGGRVR